MKAVTAPIVAAAAMKLLLREYLRSCAKPMYDFRTVNCSPVHGFDWPLR
jgi:hypothetical protein